MDYFEVGSHLVALIMPKESKCLYEPGAFWTMLGAQQVVTVFSICKLVIVLRMNSKALANLYVLVILFSLGMN